MVKNITAPTTKGNQPPVGIFMQLGNKYDRSINRKNDKKLMLVIFFHCHNAWMTIKAKIVVVIMVPVTAIP